MKKMLMAICLVPVVAFGTFVWAAHHEGEHAGEHQASGWFDAHACDICKPWTESPEMMTAMDWETHSIKNGMMMVSVVPDSHREKFDVICKKMDQTIGKIAAGEQPKGLCGFCQAMGGLMEAGAKTEDIATAFGKITLITADNPQTVAKIHAVAKRAQQEAKKMAAAMKQVKWRSA